MNLYADTSALIKNYIVETDSTQVISYFSQFPMIGTSALTQAEVASAVSKALRLKWINEGDAVSAWNDFLSRWPAMVRLPVSTVIIEHASTIAWRHGLRAYDSIHLASAMLWKEISGDQVVFACFDRNLAKAGRSEGLEIWPTF